MNESPMPGAAIRREFESAALHHRAGRVPAAANPSPEPASTGSVEGAIAQASSRTGVDFGYLVAQAEVESAMNPLAKARSSSATGLYQFIDSTWLGTMQRHGARFGLGDIAAEIATGPGGNAFVADPARRAAILDMRNDPQIASLMAAGLAQDNRSHLAPILGREPSHDELYLAHFLGAGSAGRFLSEMQRDPVQSAAALFARPAAANRAIFYTPGGTPRSLAQVMDVLGTKLARAGAETHDPARFTASAGAQFAQAGIPALPASLPPGLAGGSTAQPRMSAMLRATFGADAARVGASPEAAQRIHRAYGTLRAMGL